MPHYEVPIDLLNRFADQINEGRYYEAHESMEEIWILNDRPRPSWLQSLVQIAASLEHWKRGNVNGARALALRALPYKTSGSISELDQFSPYDLNRFVQDFTEFAHKDFRGSVPLIHTGAAP